MIWFKKEKYTLIRPQKRKDIPDGLWSKCQSCQEILYNQKLQENFKVCPKCGYHFPLTLQERIDQLMDAGTFEEMDINLFSKDPLGFVDTKSYQERLKEAQEKTSLKEAFISGYGVIQGRRCIIGILDFSFIGGSMASVVGEKVTRAIERAGASQLPLITLCASGGARMQEGILSLMQMAKTCAALRRFKEQRLPYLSVLTNPTTGGVMASFAALGDILIAEPKALIGFAGPRVIAQTVGEKLPEGFQTAEFVLEHGLVDVIVPRPHLKETISRLLNLLCP